MSFVSALGNQLLRDEPIDDLSRNEKLAQFNFIGVKETFLTLELVALTKADGLTEDQISELCDKLFNITKIVSYEDFGLNAGPRNPNSLLCFVFEDECPASLINFIKKQTKITHWGRSAVLVSWAIDVKNKQIYTHNNPVSVLPPVVILKEFTLPNVNYLKSFLNSYGSQWTPVDNDVQATLQSFRKLEKKVEEIYKLFKSVPRHKYENDFPNAKIVNFIHVSQKYIRNIDMNKTGDTYNVKQAGAVGKHARADHSTFIYSEPKQNLVQAAEEIQRLLKQLKKTNPNATEAEKVAYVNDETTPSFKRRFVGALKAGGEAIFDQFILENKVLKVIKAVAKEWWKIGS